MAALHISRMEAKLALGRLGTILIIASLAIAWVMVMICLAIAASMTSAIAWLSNRYTIARHALSGHWRMEPSYQAQNPRMRNSQPKRYSGFSAQMSGQSFPGSIGKQSSGKL